MQDFIDTTAGKTDGVPPGGHLDSSSEHPGEFCEFGEFFSGQENRAGCDLTLLRNSQGHATKVFGLDEKGALLKHSAANIYEGEAERLTITGLGDLKELIENLPPTSALCFGVAEKQKARLLTQEALRGGAYPDAIARDRQHFSFLRGQPGILMLDCDPRPGNPALHWQDIDQIIAQIVPGWSATQRLWRASSSAFINTSEGSELIGRGGWRCYAMVDDAAAIPAVGAYIYQRLWELEHGYIVISKAGQALRWRAPLWKRAVEHRVLSSDFVLHREGGTTITVGEVLADADRWHQARFADPLEPSYRGDSRIAYANLQPLMGRDPYLYNHAHGGICYRLVREAAEILLEKGARPRALDAALAVIRERRELYERGGEMVREAGDTIRPVTDPWLNDYCARHIRFYEMKLVGEDWVKVPADPPIWLCQQTNAKSGERGLRELKAIITAPTLRLDGSILSAPGYDAGTGLLLKGGGWPKIPEDPKPEMLPRVFEMLWRPFSKFPFVTKEDRGVMVACILTAAVRRSLPRTPAFSFDAPVAASGKTLLGQCMLRLAGSPPDMVPECRDEEELRKRLLSALRQGQPGILLDNIRGQFGSAALEGFLTSELYTDRVLGVSQMLSLPTNVLFLISGNNFHPKGDLYRRILTARIDAKTDAPERRTFKIDPLEYCHEHRQSFVAATLILLRGFIAAGQPRTTRDRLASFERWDDLIRQCVLWMANQGIADLGDPTACIQRAKEQEPERQKLAAFLEATAAAMEARDWRIADLVRKADSDWLDGRLKDALDEIAGDRGKINPRILGRWIERYADNRCAGYYLERRGTKQRAMVWRIRKYQTQ